MRRLFSTITGTEKNLRRGHWASVTGKSRSRVPAGLIKKGRNGGYVRIVPHPLYQVNNSSTPLMNKGLNAGKPLKVSPSPLTGEG